VNSADFIRQHTRAHLMFVHHSGKDQAAGARGHSLLRAATDTEIEISRENKDAPSVARVTKQREMEIEGTFVFTLETVVLGKNRRGKDVTSCVVQSQEGDGPARQAKKARLAPAAQVSLDALNRAIDQCGEHRKGMHNVPGTTRSVTEDQWRAAFYAASSAPTQRAKIIAFGRAQEALAAARIALLIDGHAWVVKD
jgi:hypothetical protein